MRILHIITNTELGGAQKVCIDLCNSAVKDGNQVAVASMQGGYLWDQLNKSVKQYQLKYMVKPIKPLKDIKVLRELKKVKKDFKPDIIQLHSSKAGVLGRIIGLGMSKQVVYTVHGFDSIRLKHRIFLPLENVLQHFCGAIVGVSDYDKVNLLSEKIKNNVITIHNGIDNALIPILLNTPSWIEGSKIVMSIARISPPKKFDMFLSVAKEFENSNCKFVWIGGCQECSLDELQKEYEIPRNVLLLGDVPNASQYLKFADLFVLFSNFEGLPMTIIEAMSQGKAIVASDVGGINELVDSSNGALIQNDIGIAKNEIEKILNNDDIRYDMEKESLRKYNEQFTLDSMWENYKKVYNKLLKK